MKKVFTLHFSWVTLLFFAAGFHSNAQQIYQQLPECTALVPYFEKDLSYSPTASFTTPEFNRKPGCCGNTDNNDDYVSFYVTLHPDVAMFELVVAPGYADPPGAGIYNIISGDMITPSSCGVDIPGGAPVCITGSGPHKITYFKPGNNKIKYIFRQIPKPIYPADQGTRINCTLPLPIYGLNNINITAISSTNVDAGVTNSTLNSYMSCLNCEDPVFSPGVNSSYPYTITYQVTGTPKAAACGVYPTSGTFTITVYDELTITSSNETFCAGGSGATLTGTADGGDGNYNYFWIDATGDTLVWTQNYLTDIEGIYTIGVSDGLSTATCPNPETTVSVSIANTPIVNAGPDKTACQSNPTVQLGGSVEYANTLWVGGLGTFTPNRFTANATYTPTLTEITNAPHSVTLTLTSTDAGGGCVEQSDQVTISYSTNMDIVPTITPIVCYGQTSTISTVVNGGVSGYSYEWSTGSSNSDILVSAGTYGLTVTDSYLCKTTEYFTVNQPTPIELALSSTDETVLGNDGSVSIVVSGGGAPYTIVWTNQFSVIVGTGNSVSPLPDGIYTATVADANGCTVSASTVINTFACSGHEVSAVATNVLCYNGTTGTVTATPSGGSGSYSYSWNTTPVASTTQTVNNLPDGTYTVTLTDINTGCFDMFSVTIYQPTQLTNTMTQTNVTTEGGSDGTATASPQGGTPVYDFLWSNGQSGNDLLTHTATGLSAGSYSVQITDDNNCTITDNVTITQPPCTDFIIAVNTINPLCNGQNGSASVYISTGTWTSIAWSTGASNVTSVTGLAAGSYSVQVTSAGCTATKNFTITQPDPISIGLATSNITCAGIQPPNGSIDLTVSGGTYPQYSYSWSSLGKVISETQDVYMLPAGTYTVTITDENGCTASASIGITQPQELISNYTYTDNLCFGQSLGTINATTTGGTLPYTFNWVNSAGGSIATTEDLNNLAFGNYYLTVTDGNNCPFGPMLIHISQPELLTASAVMTQEVSCAGVNDGAANLTVTGGVSLYSYSWIGPGYTSSNEDPTGMPDGTFTVLVTDANSCTTTTSATITTVIDVTNPTITCPSNVSVPADLGECFATGVSLGTPITADNCLVFSVTNTAPVSYPFGGTIVTWTVLDGLGNSASCDQTVNVFDNQNPTISCPPNVTDYANPDVCTAALSGVDLGTPLTDDNCSVASVSNNAPTTFVLGSNTVTWTVMDASGLTSSCNQTVTIIDDQAPSITCPNPVSVNTGTNNCIATGVLLGSPITDDNCSVLSATNNAPSVYNLGETTVTWIVTDGSNNTTTCTQVVTVTDIIPPVIICPGTVTVNADPGVCTTASVSLGTPGTTDNCSVATVVNNSPSPFPLGTTIVIWTVTDGSGNTANCPQTVIVNDIQDPTITCPTTVSVTADAGSCGATGVDLGTPVTDDNCSVAQVSNNAPSTFQLGTTTVTWIVTDGSGNTAECAQQVIVSDDEDPVIVDCPIDFTVNNDNGDCGAIVTWTPPTYADNCGAVMTFSHIPGTYFEVGTTAVTYTVTDGSGNVSICSFDVTVDDNEDPILTCPTTIETCEPFVEFNYPTAVDNCQALTVIQTAGLPSGIDYSVGTTVNAYSVTDIHGNTSTCNFSVVVFPVPVISFDVTQVSCNGFGDGEIDATISVGTAPYNYTWTNGADTEDLTSLIPGTYSLTVIDDNGCTDNSATMISQPAALTLQSIDDNVNCFNGSDGSINLTINGGTTPYNFNWNEGSDTEDLTGLEMGNYDVTVTDAKGCEVTYATTISQPDSLMITGTPYPANCGSATGLITVNVTGGTNPYTFNWSDGSTGMSLYNVSPDIYTLSVVDALGCANTFTDTVKSISDLSATLSARDVRCYGENNGEISADILSGYAPFTYVWSDGQSTSNATDLAAGSYSVTITDLFGCEVTLSTDVNQPDSLYIVLSNSLYSGGYNISQYGGDDGYINSTVFGGISPYDYSWFGPQEFSSDQPNIANLEQGAYLLTVIDANGCKANISSRLTQPDILEMPNGFSPNGDKDNENFVIHGIDAYPDNTIQVFNRWGNLVYELDGYNNEWNGYNMNGEPLPDGTYFVVLIVRINGEDLEPLTGYVDLRR